MISTLIVEGGIYIKIFNYIYNRKNKERVVLSLTAKEISLLINSLYISQKSISENLLDVRFLYLDKNICGAMYYMQRLLACRANEQLYNKESDFFIGNSAMLKKNK